MLSRFWSDLIAYAIIIRQARQKDNIEIQFLTFIGLLRIIEDAQDIGIDLADFSSLVTQVYQANHMSFRQHLKVMSLKKSSTKNRLS